MNAIRCICLDVDGVLTDGRLFVDDAGRGGRVFHVHDGFAIHWFLRLGGTVILCSGKTSPAVQARADELGIAHVIQGSRDKLADLSRVLDELGIPMKRTAVVGDDLPDLPIMHASGLPCAVANAVPEVRAAAAFVTHRPGGHGAVREVVEHIMRTDGMWNEVLRTYGAADGVPRGNE